MVGGGGIAGRGHDAGRRRGGAGEGRGKTAEVEVWGGTPTGASGASSLATKRSPGQYAGC